MTLRDAGRGEYILMLNQEDIGSPTINSKNYLESFTLVVDDQRDFRSLVKIGKAKAEITVKINEYDNWGAKTGTKAVITNTSDRSNYQTVKFKFVS